VRLERHVVEKARVQHVELGGIELRRPARDMSEVDEAPEVVEARNGPDRLGRADQHRERRHGHWLQPAFP
jgi:hypothetical protein